MMYYKINKDGSFGGFYSKQTVEDYNIENVFSISIKKRDEIIDLTNNKGYVLNVNKDNSLSCVKKEVSEEELLAIKLNDSILLYSRELEFANKASIEFEFGIISSEDFDCVKSYIKSINPYSIVKTKSFVSRPSVLDRYK
ncbi:MAG: hypothetical protein RR744_00565 [Cellulosilyticaceae bacterium]